MNRAHLLVVAASLVTSFAGRAEAAVVPNAFAGTDAPVVVFLAAQGAFTRQYLFAASQFSTIAPGSTIRSIGFRLDAATATVATPLNFSNFDISLGTSTRAVGGLGNVFADNVASQTIVRSGALSIAGNSFVGGQILNPFYTINFTTPYVYGGGDLLLGLIGDGQIANFALDAVSVGGVTDSVSNPEVAFATTGFANLANVPVVEFGFQAAGGVPEPSMWFMMIGGFGLAGISMRRRAAVAAASSC